jgi:hypothetical protein
MYHREAISLASALRWVSVNAPVENGRRLIGDAVERGEGLYDDLAHGHCLLGSAHHGKHQMGHPVALDTNRWIAERASSRESLSKNGQRP